MAITGKIEDILHQINLSEGIEKGLKYLQKNNLSRIFERTDIGCSNVVEIDGKNLFAVFSKYNTKVNTPPVFEGHRRYIDIQFIIKGEEQVFLTSGSVTNRGDYDEENDCLLCRSKSYSTIRLTPGIVAILFPEDWHAPGQQSVQTEEVLKVVMKVAL